MTEVPPTRTPEEVRRALAEQIGSGRLRPGQRLGAERALAAEFGVSRATLRQALAVLEEGGAVRRVPGRGGGTFSLEHARFPARRLPGLLELPLGGSVYELLEEHFSAEPDEAVERIEVVLASPDEAAILDVEPGAPLLAITRTTTDPDGDPIEFSRDLFRADRTRIVVRTEGGGASRGVPGRARVVELHA